MSGGVGLPEISLAKRVEKIPGAVQPCAFICGNEPVDFQGARREEYQQEDQDCGDFLAGAWFDSESL